MKGLTKSAWIWVRTLVVRRISWKLLIFIIIRWFTDNLPPCCWGSLWSSPRAIRNSFGDRRARGNSPLWGIIWNKKLRWRFFHSRLLLDPTFSSYQMFICPLVQLGNQLVQNYRDKALPQMKINSLHIQNSTLCILIECGNRSIASIFPHSLPPSEVHSECMQKWVVQCNWYCISKRTHKTQSQGWLTCYKLAIVYKVLCQTHVAGLWETYCHPTPMAPVLIT